MAQRQGVARAPTRERLIHAAAELLERGGYAAAPVSAIAERAGVSAGALYRHFPSKAELFVEVFRRAAETELVAMGEAAAAKNGSLERVEAVIATYATRALASRRLTWALVYEPVDPLVDAERLAYRRAYRERMAGALREAIAGGEIPEQDADLAAAAIVGAIAEALVGPISPLGRRSPPDDDVVAGIVRFCRQALGA